jgi:hypothetical protein
MLTAIALITIAGLSARLYSPTLQRPIRRTSLGA